MNVLVKSDVNQQIKWLQGGNSAKLDMLVDLHTIWIPNLWLRKVEEVAKEVIVELFVVRPVLFVEEFQGLSI